jgi:multimeric flavodoxin WrbA
MPKTLVVVPSRTGRLAALADAFVEGARSVRFAEVDVRRLDETDVGAEGVAGYDAIALGAPVDDEAVPDALARLLDEAGALVDVVGSAFAPPSPTGRDTALWALLASMGARGMILVTPGAPPAAAGAGTPDEAALAAAREQGRRVATVAGWVRHARGHEHGHSHAHGHSH